MTEHDIDLRIAGFRSDTPLASASSFGHSTAVSEAFEFFTLRDGFDVLTVKAAVGVIISGLWNNTNEEDVGFHGFCAQLIARIIEGQDSAVDLSALRDYCTTLRVIRNRQTAEFVEERAARRAKLRASSIAAIEARAAAQP